MSKSKMIVSKIIENLKFKDRDKVESDGSCDVKFKKENFFEFKRFKSLKQICFVDGGIGNIASGNNFSIDIIRTYFTVYQKNRRIKHDKTEYLAISEFLGNDIISKLFLVDGFSLDIKTFIISKELSEVPNIIRKKIEILSALRSLSLLEAGDMLVMDGTLDDELGDMSLLFDAGLKKDVLITGLSKTSTLLTDNKDCLLTYLSSFGNKFFAKSMWAYRPIAINSGDKQEVLFAKFHELSDHVFRFEMQREQAIIVDIKNVLGFLAINSTDPTFFGYPYGLIDADRFARISDEERDHLRMVLIESYPQINRYLRSTDAHSILDNM